jgi:hypothetical protein
MNTSIAGSNTEFETAAAGRETVRMGLLVCGILASLIRLGIDIFASLSYEGYRYPLDPISGLSAVGAPTRLFVVPLFNLYLVLKIAFAVGVWISAGQKRAVRITAALLFASGLTDLAACFFPWNPAENLGTFGNMMHGILAGGLTVILILLTILFGAGADGRRFRLFSYALLVIMIVMGALPLLGGFGLPTDEIPEWFGAGERINGYGYMLWMLVLAIVLLRIQSKSARREDKGAYGLDKAHGR